MKKYRYYPTLDRQSTTIKPWGYKLAKELAIETKVPITKIVTDSVELAYQLHRDGKFKFPNNK